MAEEKSGGLRSAVTGWIKAGVTSVVGLVSGAMLMYLTPVVNNVIKPAKPLANFATHVDGLSVDFNNRSTGGVQGWWDFGDGTALEPFDPKLENVKHAYAKPAAYSVKLTLQNLIGDESDRTVSVTLDADSAAKPEIAQFDLTSITPGDCVPAVFKLQCKVNNASFCILSYDDDRPMEVADFGSSHERYISFNQKGQYLIRFAAVNGTQLVEKTQNVNVGGSTGTGLTAKLSVSYDAVQVSRPSKEMRIHCGWQAGVDGDVCPVRKERLADPGCTIASAVLVNENDPNAPIRNVKLDIAPDRSKIILTGELLKSSSWLAAKTIPPHWLADVKVVMERRTPAQTIDRGDVVMPVSLNNATKIPLQPLGDGWLIVGKRVNLQLLDGAKQAWSGNSAVTGAPVLLQKQTCYVTVNPQDDGFLLTVETATPAAPLPVLTPTPLPITADPPPRVGPTIRPASFERYPLLPLRPAGN